MPNTHERRQPRHRPERRAAVARSTKNSGGGVRHQPIGVLGVFPLAWPQRRRISVQQGGGLLPRLLVQRRCGTIPRARSGRLPRGLSPAKSAQREDPGMDPVTKDRSRHSARGRARGNSLPFDESSDSDFEAGEGKAGAPIIANSSTSATLVEGGKPHLPPPPGAAL